MKKNPTPIANRIMFFASACDAAPFNKSLSCDTPSVITSKIFFADGLDPPFGVNSSLLVFEIKFRRNQVTNINTLAIYYYLDNLNNFITTQHPLVFFFFFFLNCTSIIIYMKWATLNAMIQIYLKTKTLTQVFWWLLQCKWHLHSMVYLSP